MLSDLRMLSSVADRLTRSTVPANPPPRPITIPLTPTDLRCESVERLRETRERIEKSTEPRSCVLNAGRVE